MWSRPSSRSGGETCAVRYPVVLHHVNWESGAMAYSSMSVVAQKGENGTRDEIVCCNCQRDSRCLLSRAVKVLVASRNLFSRMFVVSRLPITLLVVMSLSPVCRKILPV